MTATLGFGASMAADWPTYPPRKAHPVTMQQLVREAAELRPDHDGALVAVTFTCGEWLVDVYVTAPEARPLCDRNSDTYGVISVNADTFDAAVAESMRRVEDAVAATPAHIIAY